MWMLYTVFSSPTLQAAATALDERHHPRRAPRRFLVDVEQTSHHPRRRRAPRNSATLVDVEPLGERQRPGQRRATSVNPYHPRRRATGEPDQENVYIVHNFKWHIVRLDRRRQRATGEPDQGKCVCYTQFS